MTQGRKRRVKQEVGKHSVDDGDDDDNGHDVHLPDVHQREMQVREDHSLHSIEGKAAQKTRVYGEDTNDEVRN